MKLFSVLTITTTLAALIILVIRNYLHAATFSLETSLIILTISTLLLATYLITNSHDSSH